MIREMFKPVYVLPPHAADIVRWSFLGLCAFVAAISLNIVYRYWKLPKQGRSRALIRHVIVIGISYFLFVFAASMTTVTNLDQPASPALFIRGLAAITGIYGFYAMILHLAYERRALNNALNPHKKCHECGSHVVDYFCARCGVKQPKP